MHKKNAPTNTLKWVFPFAFLVLSSVFLVWAGIGECFLG